jgi:ATP-dependent helicase/nuclease subunit B
MMAKSLPRVLTIAAGGAFLDILAENILARFPTFETDRPLTDWTVLVPTRRAALALAAALKKQSSAKALLLPRIKPIGDLDEDFLQLENAVEKPVPQSPLAQLLQLLNLVDQWAKENPQIKLATEIAGSAMQRLNLAKSLQDLLITVETNECTFEKLGDAYNVDLSDHRSSILSLLDLVKYRLPTLNHQQGQVSAITYRNRILRLEAARIASGEHKGPIIAAGSTGTIPATRALLTKIAAHPQGAVILPGLDKNMDEASWQILPQEHPQYSMQLFLREVGLKHSEVLFLGQAESPRNLLVSELMRPSGTAETWHHKLPSLKPELEKAVEGITEISAPDRHLEARAIAVIMRRVLADKDQTKTAALITPDRDLVARVKAELWRWNITITDTAALKLNTTAQGGVFDLLLEAARDDFSIASVIALITHPEVTLSFELEKFALSRHQYEFACLRGNPFLASRQSFEAIAQAAELRSSKAYRNHPLVQSLEAEDWANCINLGRSIDSLLDIFTKKSLGPFSDHLAKFIQALVLLCPNKMLAPELQIFLQELTKASHQHPACSLYDACLVIQHLLRAAPVAPSFKGHPRLAIYGTLEARLMQADVVILGGLNETIWPAQADPGPWLNRSMRDMFGLPHPERDLGLAAHDFEQGFCASQVYLTSSQRIGSSPATPSRWLLRLKAVLSAAQIEVPTDDTLALAKSLDEAGPMQARGKPNFAPPVASRPTSFSVTEIEKLVRNPYAIYAKRILHLEPLDAFGAKQDASLRGSVFHDALALWNQSEERSLATLIKAGETLFDAYAIGAETKRFWWPHFMRAAQFIAQQEEIFAETTSRIFSEVNGKISFNLSGIDFELKARADRVDLLRDGTARIMDYKTGQPPTQPQVKTFLSPQLTLEAAIVIEQGFKNIQATKIAEILYLQLGGGRQGLNKIKIKPDLSLEELALAHLAHLKTLLGIYLEQSVPYLPRLRVEKDATQADYDHLSRYLEWQLAGEQ